MVAGANTTDWDEDIAELNLSDVEKNGLQVYRNYVRAFTQKKIEDFVVEIDQEAFSLEEFTNVAEHIVLEDTRFLPILACSYADDVLRDMYMQIIPRNIDNGRKSLISQFGPLSTLYLKTQIAHSFSCVSEDLVFELHKIRKARNKISHSCNLQDLTEFYSDKPVSEIVPVEATLQERDAGIHGDLNDEQAFRIRLVWVLSRLFYECALYVRAKEKGICPREALYGKTHPRLLGKVSKVALDASRRIAG